ncbi:hypothetical protein VPH35_116163 [Triticum aestivum]|uniref:Uncharacterized protein n=2 Tax=Aegilops tauschii subsp. strangulata TaxID=200361 RepID=A0A453NEA7_AEGTS
MNCCYKDLLLQTYITWSNDTDRIHIYFAMYSTNFAYTAANWPLQTKAVKKERGKLKEHAATSVQSGRSATAHGHAGSRPAGNLADLISLGPPEQQVHHLGRLAVAVADAVLRAPPQLPPRRRAGTGQVLPLLAVARRRPQRRQPPPPALAPVVAHVVHPTRSILSWSALCTPLSTRAF